MLIVLLFEFTLLPSKTKSCEKVSRPRKIPQIDFDSRCALVFSIFNASVWEIISTITYSECYGIIPTVAYILLSFLDAVFVRTAFSNQWLFRPKVLQNSSHANSQPHQHSVLFASTAERLWIYIVQLPHLKCHIFRGRPKNIKI